MRAKIFIGFLILLHSIVTAQVNKYGYPLIKRYLPEDYNAHNENWMGIVSSTGKLYFANTNGVVLEYDGTSWHTIKTLKNTPVYYLKEDRNTGIIYVGCAGDFGYIKSSEKGEKKYYTLTKNIKDTIISNLNFRKIFIDKEGNVYYCSPLYIYKYDKKSVKPIKLPNNSWQAFQINNKLYISNEDYGLIVLDKNDKVEIVQNATALKGRYINLVQRIKNNEYLLYLGDEFVVYDFNTGNLKNISANEYSAINYLKEAVPYYSFDYNDKIYWATIYGGIVVTNNKFKIEQVLTDTVGLTHNGVSSLLINETDNTIWATTLQGINKIEISPLACFNENNGLKGIIYNVVRFNGDLYVASDNGLYKIYYQKTKTYFENISFFKNTSIQNIAVSPIQKILWVATLNGLYVYDGTYSKLITKDIIAEYILPSKINDNLVYLGSQMGLWIARYVNGFWQTEKVKNIDGYITSIIEDEEGNIWVTSQSAGLYKYKVNSNRVEHFSIQNGLPSDNDLYTFYYNNRILVATQKGVYTFENNRFVPYYGFGNQLTEKKRPILAVYKGYNNGLILNISNRIYLLKPHYEEFIIDSVALRRLPKVTIYNVYTEPNGIIWIATNKGLYSYNSTQKIRNTKTSTYIAKLRINTIDSLIYFNPLIKNQVLTFDYKYNNITFYFYTPYYIEEGSTEYSYKLDGFDSQWSAWSNETKANYTNISEGEYTFWVKARNIFLEESIPAKVTIIINPPWYRTFWAYLGYVIIAIVLIIVIIKLYTRKLEADKRRLEKIVEERTQEVVRQKNEIEEKNKVIEQKNKDITDSIYYAKRIQDSILPPLSVTERCNVEVGIYYKPKDIVSGDFYFIRNFRHLNIVIIAAADCTGHGVPGAFMSMLGASLLNEIITKPEIQHTDQVLNELREGVINSLNQEGKISETRDGMDIALIAFDYKNYKVEFSGANNPLYFIRDNELTEYKADKMPVGLYERNNELFSRHELDVKTGDVLYIFSDGFADQFGGDKGKKYLYKRFKEFLLSIHHLPMKDQVSQLNQEALRWRGEIEQIDDQLVIGIRIL